MIKKIILYLIVLILLSLTSSTVNPVYFPIKKTVVMIGTVISIPENQYQSLQFIFQPRFSHETIWVNWPQAPAIQMQVGQLWKLALSLKSTDKPWLKTQHIYQQGSVVFDSDNQMILPRKNHDFIVEHFRESIYLKIIDQLKKYPQLSEFTGFISALTTGIRSDITQEQWQDLRGTGTNHLMAIAGLHIGFLSWITYTIFNFIWRRSEKCMLFKPAQIASLLGSFIFAFFYSLLAGFSLPTERAMLMLGFYVLSQFFYIKIPIGISYLCAIFFILITSVFSIETPTFWLSFIAVGLLIFTHSHRVGRSSTWKALVKAQWVLAIGLAPLGLFFFGQTSFLGVIANLLAIPFVGFIILPLCLMGIIFNKLWIVAAFLLHYFWPLMHYLSNISEAQWKNPLSFWQCAALMWATLILLAPKGFPHRWIGVLGCLTFWI